MTQRTVRAGVLLGILTLASGCAMIGAGSFCRVAEPILVDGADVFTRETAEQILAHNLVGRELCGWGD